MPVAAPLVAHVGIPPCIRQRLPVPGPPGRIACRRDLLPGGWHGPALAAKAVGRVVYALEGVGAGQHGAVYGHVVWPGMPDAIIVHVLQVANARLLKLLPATNLIGALDIGPPDQIAAPAGPAALKLPAIFPDHYSDRKSVV